MCKYCKNLKRIKDLREKELTEIIELWRRRDAQARRLISKLYGQLLYEGSSVIFISREVDDFLNTEWIGK